MKVIIMFMDGTLMDVFCRFTVNLNVGPIPWTYNNTRRIPKQQRKNLRRTSRSSKGLKQQCTNLSSKFDRFGRIIWDGRHTVFQRLGVISGCVEPQSVQIMLELSVHHWNRQTSKNFFLWEHCCLALFLSSLRWNRNTHWLRVPVPSSFDQQITSSSLGH